MVAEKINVRTLEMDDQDLQPRCQVFIFGVEYDPG